MGSFANALFSVLLGWLRSAAAWLWQLVSGEGTSFWVTWVLDNWLPLTLLLCIGGIAVDLVVYLFRWQPYRVWRRFLRSDREEEPETDSLQDDGTPRIQQRWIYADGSSVPVQEVQQPTASAQTAQLPVRRRDERLEAPLRPVKRVQPAKVRRGSGEIPLPDLGDGEAYHQPYYPPQWTAKTDDRGGDQ